MISVPGPSAPAALLFPPHEPKVKSCSKVNYTDKVADISMTEGFFLDYKDLLHNTGIPAAHKDLPLPEVHSGTSGKGRSLYMFPFGDQCPLMLVTSPAQGAVYAITT